LTSLSVPFRVVGSDRKPSPRLRDLNKRRTRQAIVRVAVALFAEQGYRATTLVEIASAAGCAPSTLHTYFPYKDDLVFSVYDAVLESARKEILGGPACGAAALLRWVEHALPDLLTTYGADVLVMTEEITRADPELLRQQRFRDALLGDVLAEAFVNDPGTRDLLQAQVVATIAMHAIKAVWNLWCESHAADAALSDLTCLTAGHVKKLLTESGPAIDALPPATALALEFERERPANTTH
jgi:AcrR family transcriptional regulator